jgi:outer membrane protein insertion porin family
MGCVLERGILMAKLSLKLVAIGLLASTALSGSQFALAQDTAGAEQPSAPSSRKVEAKPVSFIRVEGTLRVEAETVRAYMVLREGMRAEAQLIDQSVKTLFASGLFADVNIRREGDGLIVSVIENPIINRVSFEGNIKINSDTLQGESSLRPRLVYTRSKVQDDVERFLELYRRAGRFSAVIEPKVIQLPQNRVDLVFEIVEGPFD